MYRNEIFTYKKTQLKHYINHRNEEDIEVLTLAQVERNGLKSYEDEQYINLDIDLTSTIQLLNGGNALNYAFENLIEFFREYQNVKFIVDEKYEKEVLLEFPYFFTISIPIEAEEEVQFQYSESIEDITTLKRKIVDLDNKEMQDLFDQIEVDLTGHHDFKKDFSNKVKEFTYFYKQVRDQPIISFFLLGASGLGKTEIARIIHNYLDGETPLAKINFGNYSNESSLASLIGSPPGFKNSGEDSDLIKKIKSSNSGILIVDEFEKANKSVHNFFLQLLEEGKFDDAMGQIFDLNGYMIIFTSNLNKREYIANVSPELRSRFNGVYLMKDLSESAKKEYAKKIIDWYFEKSNEKKCDEKVERIIGKVDIKNESNLRTLKFRLRSAFYAVNNPND